VPERPPRPPRAETREIVELRQLKAAQPELASAIDMQIALVDMQRRVQSRVPLPWIQVDPDWQKAQQSAGRPLVRFKDIPLEWSDFRLTFRQTADILQRFDALERADYDRIVALGRDGNALEPAVAAWYEATSGVEPGTDPRHRAPSDAPASLDQVLVLALRPFLARCAEALAQKVDLGGWSHGHCPVCGWEPDFAVITPSAERRLFCGRCVAQWSFPSLTCPFCANDDRALITSFATRDGRYRVSACDVCRRYIKAYDARRAQRPVMVAVDSIATLPLDAAAMQRGYVG
jgi:Protein involved in formate dehydrogenase formation